MLPVCLPSQHALSCRLRIWQAGLSALAMALACSAPNAFAQDIANEPAPVVLPSAPQAHTAPDDATPVAADEGEPIGFEADGVEYNDNDKLLTAKGNVVLRHEDESVRADVVTWNSDTGQIFASGNVRLVDADGNQLFTDSVELTDDLRVGAMENMLLAFREGGRLAARHGRRDENGNVVVTDAAYTACEIETRAGCPRKPSWRIVAKEVTYDEDEKIVRFGGARLVLFGILPIPLPGLSVATDGSSTAGFLVPGIAYSSRNGLELSGTYYWRIDPNRDISLTATGYSKAPPMISGQYRALTSDGAYQVTGYATRSKQTSDAGDEDGNREFRGYLFANGRFQLSPKWSVTGSIRRASDRTFLRRYDISRDDRLRSMIDIERIDTDSYFSLAGWATQTMRINTPQGQIPIALPVLDYRKILHEPLLGGKVQLQANTLAITRTHGQDTQRAFLGARWDRTRLTTLGQEVTFTALVRGDVYHSDENELTPTPSYRGLGGWQKRGVATAAIDVKWPFTGPAFGGQQVLIPRVQLVASPSIANDVPNEDSRAIDLDDSNLFALNRAPGYDRVEDGVRVTYGADWQWERPRWRVMATLGQSYRLTSAPSLLPDGTGLTDRFSDYVGRTEVRYRDFVKFTHRYRLDKDNFAVRRNEIDATIGNQGTYAEIGYLRLNRDIAFGLEDLADREELRAAGRIAFARYWSIFGAGAFILTNAAEDPLSTADGFEPLRSRLGAAYADDCLEVALTWRRDYVTTGDARKGNTFQIFFALRNLGFQ